MLKERHFEDKLILLFSITYMVSYLTRINYGAVISEVESATGFSKQVLSMAVTGGFITYGVGQMFSGVLGDIFAPKKLVFFGLGVTVLMNLLLPFSQAYWSMIVIWSINGLAQAFMWPPLIKLAVSLLDNEAYNKGIVKISWGSSIGTIIIYLLSPIIIKFAGWKGVFIFSAFCGIAMMAIWQRFCPDAAAAQKRISSSTEAGNTKLLTPVFLMIAITIIICGMLRDGVATWTPSLISETFNLSNSSGIFSGAMLPVFGMICHQVASILYRTRFKNPVNCAGVIFFAGVISSFMLVFSLKGNPLLSVIAISLLNGAMHGVNLMLVGMLPAFYEKTGRISLVSGIINSFVYIGSAISTYGIAYLTDTYGWNVTVVVWFGLAIVGTAICFFAAPIWKKTL